MKNNNKNYMILGLMIILYSYAVYLALTNKSLMLPGYKQMFLIIFIIIIPLSIYINFINNKTKFRKTIYIFTIFILSGLINLSVLKAYGYNYYQNSSTVLDYFLDSGNRNIESVTVDYATYSANIEPVFYDLLEDKEIYVDSNITDNNIVSIIRDLKYKTADISINNDLNLYIEKYNPQIIRYYDSNEKEEDLLIFTGNTFDSSKEIYLTKFDNKVCVFGKDSLDFKVTNILNSVKNKIQNNTNAYKTAILELHRDTTINRLLSGSGPQMIILFLLFINISGFVFLFPFLKNKSKINNLIILLSFPVGAVLQIFVTILLGLVGIQINLIHIIILLLAILFLWNLGWYRFDKEKTKYKFTLSNFMFLLYIIVIICFFAYKAHSFMSYDSYMNILIGKKIAYSESLQQNIGRLLMFSFINPLWQTLASLFRINYNYAIQPVFVTLGISALIYLQYRLLVLKGIKKAYALGLALLVTLNFMTLPEAVINSSWILNNLDIGILYGLAVALMLLYFKDKNKIYIIISYFLFIITGIARIEGGLFAIIYLIFIYTSDLNNLIKKTLISCFTLIYTILFLFNLANVKDIEEGFWTPQKSLMILILLFIFNLFIIFDKIIMRKLNYLIKNIDYLMLLSIISGGLLLSVLNPEKALSNFNNFIMNFISSGYYGAWLLFILFIFGLYFRCNSHFSKDIRMLFIQTVSYITLIFVLMLLNIYDSRVGYGDSSCRMILHILPVSGLLLLYMMAEVYLTTEQK